MDKMAEGGQQVLNPRVEQVEADSPRLLTPERVVTTVLLLALLGVWEAMGRKVGAFFLAPPSAMAGAAWMLISSGELAREIGQSIQSLMIGLAGAAALGIGLGFACGWYRFLGRVVNPFISAFYVVPIAAMVPLLIIWFGLGMLPRILVVLLFAMFEILIATMNGVANVDPNLVEVARCFGVRRQWDMFRKVVFYNALPFVFAGLRIGTGRAVKGMITAELLFAVTGIGGLMVRYGNAYRTDVVFVLILVITILGVITSGLVQMLHRWIAPWVD